MDTHTHTNTISHGGSVTACVYTVTTDPLTPAAVMAAALAHLAAVFGQTVAAGRQLAVSAQILLKHQCGVMEQKQNNNKNNKK